MMVIPENNKKKKDVIGEILREQILAYAKTFKTSWVNLGQSLYSVWQDKLYHAWGYEKFEHYTQEELGIKKELCLKLLKAYGFLEQDEPAYLSEEFSEERDTINVPGYEAINLLRLAKGNKELLKEDYRKIKKDIFEKGKDASVVRKDLAALMKERKIVDVEEERDKRNEAAIKKALNALGIFKRDMETLQLIPEDIVSQANSLISKLEEQIS